MGCRHTAPHIVIGSTKVVIGGDMRRQTQVDDPNSGFGLVEVIVAMALLLIVAVAMLPVFVSSLRLSAENVSVTTATQMVSEQMDLARGLSQTCEAMFGFIDQTLDRTEEDPRGLILEVHVESEAVCPVAYPAAFPLTFYVTDQNDPTNSRIAEAETRVIILDDE